MADKCLLCLKGMSQSLDALQHCLNSKQTYMALWLWRLISVTHSSLASLAHFCTLCRWCGILCQHYLSTSSLLTQLPLWAVVENAKYWTIIQLFHQFIGFHSSDPKEHPCINTPLHKAVADTASQQRATGTSKEVSRATKRNTHGQQTFISIYSTTRRPLLRCIFLSEFELRFATLWIFFLLIYEWHFDLEDDSFERIEGKGGNYIKE